MIKEKDMDIDLSGRIRVQYFIGRIRIRQILNPIRNSGFERDTSRVLARIPLRTWQLINPVFVLLYLWQKAG